MQQAHEIANDRRRGPPDDTALVVIVPHFARTKLGDSGFAAAMSFVLQKGQRNKEDFGDLCGARRHVGRFAQESHDRSDHKSGRGGQVIKQADNEDFIGSDPEDVTDLGAEIEVTLGGEKHLINTAAVVSIPPNVEHCPIIFKKVNKPLVFLEISLTRIWKPRGNVRKKPVQKPEQQKS